jgi:predicted nucleic acid-binding protein
LRLLKLTKLSDSELTEIEGLVTNSIIFIDERLLPQELLLKSETLLKSIDPNDTPYVALTAHLEGILWTEDMKLYKGLKLKRFKEIIPTADLFLLLDDLERE